MEIYFVNSAFSPNTGKCGPFSPNTGKYEPKITPYLDTFHAVRCLKKVIHENAQEIFFLKNHGENEAGRLVPDLFLLF